MLGTAPQRAFNHRYLQKQRFASKRPSKATAHWVKMKLRLIENTHWLAIILKRDYKARFRGTLLSISKSPEPKGSPCLLLYSVWIVIRYLLVWNDNELNSLRVYRVIICGKITHVAIAPWIQKTTFRPIEFSPMNFLVHETPTPAKLFLKKCYPTPIKCSQILDP